MTAACLLNRTRNHQTSLPVINTPSSSEEAFPRPFKFGEEVLWIFGFFFNLDIFYVP